MLATETVAAAIFITLCLRHTLAQCRPWRVQICVNRWYLCITQHTTMCSTLIGLLKPKGLFMYRHVSATDCTSLYPECLCVSLVCHNKQRTFHYTALSDWPF